MAEPKKEAVRIALPQQPETVLPPNVAAPPVLNPLPKPASTKAETTANLLSPAGARPAIAQTSPVMVVPSSTIDAFDSIPRWFCWGLLGISAFIFLIQIWNYALS
jgi:hypothetical protein